MPMSAYYRDLREKAGSGLLVIPTVAAIIRNSEEEILFIRKPDETLWGLPAGAIEPGETPSRAVRREVYEETGLLVNPVGILGVFGGEKYKYEYSNGHQVEYLTVVFECSIVKGTPRGGDEEVEELQFFKENERPKLAIPYPPELFIKDTGMLRSMFE